MDLVDIMLIAGGGIGTDDLDDIMDTMLFIESDTIEGDNHAEQDELS
jgi:hypothetical protein